MSAHRITIILCDGKIDVLKRKNKTMHNQSFALTVASAFAAESLEASADHRALDSIKADVAGNFIMAMGKGGEFKGPKEEALQIIADEVKCIRDEPEFLDVMPGAKSLLAAFYSALTKPEPRWWMEDQNAERARNAIVGEISRGDLIGRRAFRDYDSVRGQRVDDNSQAIRTALSINNDAVLEAVASFIYGAVGPVGHVNLELAQVRRCEAKARQALQSLDAVDKAGFLAIGQYIVKAFNDRSTANQRADDAMLRQRNLRGLSGRGFMDRKIGLATNDFERAATRAGVAIVKQAEKSAAPMMEKMAQGIAASVAQATGNGGGGATSTSEMAYALARMEQLDLQNQSLCKQVMDMQKALDAALSGKKKN